MNKALIISLLFGLISIETFSQGLKSGTVQRESEIHLSIKDEVEPIMLNLKAKDRLDITLESSWSVNFRMYDPDDRLIEVGLASKDEDFGLNQTVDSAGTYRIELENGLPVIPLPVKADLRIVLTRSDFQLPQLDSLPKPGNREILVSSALVMPRTKKDEENVRGFNFQMGKGEILDFNYVPSKKSPFIEIRNDVGELLFASRPKKEAVNNSIPILDSCVVHILLRSRSFFPKRDSLFVQRNSPSLSQKEPTKTVMDTIEMIIQDSIPEVFMDTTIYIGALRDYVNEEEQSITFDFKNDSSIVFWAILFGAGQAFLDELKLYEPLLEGEALAAGATDVLTAYGLGYLKTLPSFGNDDVCIETSSSIHENLNAALRANYAIIEKAEGVHYVQFGNYSQSVGVNIHVKVVVFRKEAEIVVSEVVYDQKSKRQSHER